VIPINEADLIINIRANIEGLQQDILFVQSMSDKLDADQYARRVKLFNDLKNLTQVSLADQIAQYEAFAAQYAGNAGVMLDVDKNLYALKKQLADQWLAQQEADAKTAGDGTQAGYDAAIQIIKDAQAKAQEVYAQYPQSLQTVLQQLQTLEVNMTRQREDAVLAAQSAGVDAQIAQVQRLMQVQKESAGLVVTGPDGSQQTLSYGAADQIAGVRQEQSINAARIAELQAQQDLTASAKQELDKRLANDKMYANQLQDLQIQALKEAQAQQKAALEQAAAQNLAIKQQETQSYLDELQKRKSAELAAVDASARAQADALNAQIAAISQQQAAQALSQKEQPLTDDIARLQAQLAYTRPDDAYNAYELQMRINADQAKLAQDQQSQALAGQKASLQAQLAAVNDAAARQKQAIQNVYDTDAQAAKDALAAFQSAQTGRVDIAKSTAASVAKVQADSAAAERKAQADLLAQLAKAGQTAQQSRRGLVQSATAAILSDLSAAVSQFAAAGQAAGAAYANAFAAATAALLQTSGAPGAAGAGATPSGVTVNNTFNNPVQSPAALSRQIQLTLESMANFA